MSLGVGQDGYSHHRRRPTHVCPSERWRRQALGLKLLGWGLGLGDTSPRGDGPNEMGDNLPAVSLGAGKTAVAIAAGSDYTCALLNDGSVKCWGANAWGELGLGDTSKRGDGPNEMGGTTRPP